MARQEWAPRNRWIGLQIVMAEIPSALSEAFKQAIVVCYDWSGDDRQPPAVGVAWDPSAEPDPQHAEGYAIADALFAPGR